MFKNRQALEAFCSQFSLTFNIGNLTSVIWPKIVILKLIMTKSNFKNKLWRHFSNIITITSPK